MALHKNSTYISIALLVDNKLAYQFKKRSEQNYIHLCCFKKDCLEGCGNFHVLLNSDIQLV